MLWQLFAISTLVYCSSTPTDGPVSISDNDLYLYSNIAYCSSIYETNRFDCGQRCEKLKSETDSLTSFHSFDTGTGGYIVYNSKHKAIVIAFRGTHFARESMFSIVEDLMIWKTGIALFAPEIPKSFGLALHNYTTTGFTLTSKAKVHSGFLNSYLSVRENMTESLRSLAVKYPDSRILFTGHSLGGAIAQIASADTIHWAKMPISLTTFGQPRVGNLNWANLVDSLNIEVKRIVEPSDPVVHFPIQLIGYYHSKQQYNLDGTQSLPCETTGPAGESDPCLAFPADGFNMTRHLNYYDIPLLCPI